MSFRKEILNEGKEEARLMVTRASYTRTLSNSIWWNKARLDSHRGRSLRSQTAIASKPATTRLSAGLRYSISKQELLSCCPYESKTLLIDKVQTPSTRRTDGEEEKTIMFKDGEWTEKWTWNDTHNHRPAVLHNSGENLFRSAAKPFRRRRISLHGVDVIRRGDGRRLNSNCHRRAVRLETNLGDSRRKLAEWSLCGACQAVRSSVTARIFNKLRRETRQSATRFAGIPVKFINRRGTLKVVLQRLPIYWPHKFFITKIDKRNSIAIIEPIRRRSLFFGLLSSGVRRRINKKW